MLSDLDSLPVGSLCEYKGCRKSLTKWMHWDGLYGNKLQHFCNDNCCVKEIALQLFDNPILSVAVS